MTQLYDAAERQVPLELLPRSVGNILTFKGLETAIVFLMGILPMPFQTFWATFLIVEDQRLHKVVLEWESSI